MRHFYIKERLSHYKRKNELYPRCDCGILTAKCFNCMVKNTKYSDLSKEEKILGYWKTLAISALEKDLKLAFKAVFALKALGVPPYSLEKDDIEYLPVDPDGSDDQPAML